MPKPKFVKPLLIGVACTIPVGLVVGLSVNWNHTQFISAVGSSGVKPFIEKFGKKYHEQYNNIDVTVESGGTTFAVEQLTKGFTNLGNASSNPYLNISNQGFEEQWSNKKTLTLGWEGLCLMYSLPNSKDVKDKNNFEIVINENNILKLYAIFSGYHELNDGVTWDKQWENLWYYRDPSCESLISADYKSILQNTPILPFVRSGGNTGANSSIAFTMYSNLVDFKSLPESQQKAFEDGQYGNDNPHMETDESNSRAWQSFVNTNKPGSMVYLTTSFFANQNNVKQIKESGYKLARYQAKGTSEVTTFDLNDVKASLNQICVTGKFNWFRPINVMLDVDQDKTKDFIWWIYFGNANQGTEYAEHYSEIIYALGAKPINKDIHFISMCHDSGVITKQSLFSKSSADVELAKIRSGDFAKLYGAIDICE